MKRPRIGITTSYENDEQHVHHSYIRAIEAAGGLPLIVPMLTDPDAARAFTDLLDGLLMIGGPGITRGLVGNLPDDLEPVDPLRDASDTLIYNTFGTERPVLGICYGMQFINAQAGGRLFGDLTDFLKVHIEHSPRRGGTDHSLNIFPGTHLHRIFDTNEITVNSYHLQAIATVAEGFRVSATGPDGVIEAIENEDGRVMGVQFHPERMPDITAPLFEDFVARCAQTTAKA